MHSGFGMHESPPQEPLIGDLPKITPSANPVTERSKSTKVIKNVSVICPYRSKRLENVPVRISSISSSFRNWNNAAIEFCSANAIPDTAPMAKRAVAKASAVIADEEKTDTDVNEVSAGSLFFGLMIWL